MDADLNTVITVSPTVLTFLVGTFLPLLVALITKRFSDGSVKAIALLFLSIIGGWLTELQANDGSFALWPTVVNIVVTFSIAVIGHFGFWKPAKVTGDSGVIQAAVPGGIGKHVA